MNWLDAGTVAQRYAEFRKTIPRLEQIESPLERYDEPDASLASAPRKHEGFHCKPRRAKLTIETKPELRPKRTASAGKVRYQRKEYPMLPGEMPLKVFIQNESDRLGITLRSVWQRFYHHKYANVVIVRRVNCRVVFVRAATAPGAPAPAAQGQGPVGGS